MRITIERDIEDEGVEPLVYERVLEFALTGTLVTGPNPAAPLYHTHGDMHHLRERLQGLIWKLEIMEMRAALHEALLRGTRAAIEERKEL